MQWEGYKVRAFRYITKDMQKLEYLLKEALDYHCTDN